VRRLRRRRRADEQPQPRPGTSLAEAQLHALVEVASAVGAAHRLEDVLELAAERAREALGCASLSISRWEPGWIVTLVNVGRLGPGEERFPTDERYSFDDFPATAGVLAGGGMVLAAVDDEDTDPSHRELLRRLQKESSLTVPVVIEDTNWGELWAASEPGRPRLTERDGPFLRAIADQIAAAIARAELFAQVEALAYTDPLTGLANRRVLERELDRNCAAPAAPGGPAVLLCDIDGLKAVNDRAGHEAGDAVIVQVAMALTEAAAGHDDAVVSRIGGDEFCVLLPRGAPDDAREIAEDAARRLAAAGTVPVSISCGVAAPSEGVERPPELLRAADFAQYRAKRAGPEVPAAVAEPGVSAEPGHRGKDRAFRGRSDTASRALAKELLALVDEGDAPPEELLERLRRRLAEEAPRG
jgi:diguanylate cyclase (GGDEF)-like protein